MMRLQRWLGGPQAASWVAPRLQRLASTLERKESPLSSERLDGCLQGCFAHHTLPSFLQWEDRTSMANSVEARLPFMDWRVVAFLFSLPPSLKIRDGTTKWLLRHAMTGRLPRPVLERHKKQAFEPPTEAWFRDGAREFLDSNLRDALRNHVEWFVPKPLERFWRLHQAGRNGYAVALWRVVNLVRWYNLFVRAGGAPARAP
jgi:asparagine synthase (glutamine-hydrolysing)